MQLPFFVSVKSFLPPMARPGCKPLTVRSDYIRYKLIKKYNMG